MQPDYGGDEEEEEKDEPDKIHNLVVRSIIEFQQGRFRVHSKEKTVDNYAKLLATRTKYLFIRGLKVMESVWPEDDCR